MAGIDKTYTNSYKEYKEFKDWANTQVVTFFDGHKECIGSWVWNHKEEDFLLYGELPIMNTPTWLDIYLIQNCKSKFVLDRMKEVYSKEDIEYFKTIDLTAKPSDDFKQNRKITVKRCEKTIFSLHNKPYCVKNWWLQCDDDFWYNSDTKIWVARDFYYPTGTNTACIKTVKAIVRHLRKQYLPKGITFTITGGYIGEDYTIYVH